MHLVDYYSKIILLAEQNYNIYEKELIAIVNTLKYWKNKLQGAEFPTIIHTNHQNLQIFITIKVLDNRRLARCVRVYPYKLGSAYGRRCQDHMTIKSYAQLPQ